MKGEVWYIGHTSSDVLVEDKPLGTGSSNSGSTSSGSSTGSGSTSSSSIDGAFVSAPAGDLQQQPQPQEELQSPIRADFTRFIHVKVGAVRGVLLVGGGGGRLLCC
jgi:hypothetical protein